MRRAQQVEVEESTIAVRGMRLHYHSAGTGPALVLLHGIVGSGRNWSQNIAFLAKFRTVYALDLANAGESERVAGIDPGLEASADRVADFMDALQIDDADVAGHSHGGTVAMMLAARHPGRVRRLILFAPANPFCALSRPLIRFYQTRFGMAFARMVPRLPRALHKSALSRMYVDPRRIADDALDGYTCGLNDGMIDHVLGIMRNWTSDMELLQTLLARLARVPTLLIWGERDHTVGVTSGERLAETLGASLLVIPGVGHLPFAERPEICNHAIQSWLA